MGVEKRNMPKPPDMENYEIRAVGYELPLVTDCTVDIRNNDRAYRVYGRDGEVSFIELQGGNVSITALHDINMKVLADILTNQDPDTTDLIQGYYPQDDVFTHITRHLRSTDNKRYERAEFFGNWHTMLEPVVGAPGSFGTFTQAGICDAPVAFQSNKSNVGVSILTDVVYLGTADSYGGTTGLAGNFHWYSPSRIPQGAKNFNYTGKYALSVELQKRDLTNRLTDPLRQAKHIMITENMIQSVAGTVLTNPSVAASGAILGGGTPTANVSGSTLSPGTYWYKYTATDANGETLASPAMGAGIAIAVNHGQIDVTITRIPGAVRYNIYRAKATSAPAVGTYYYLDSVLDVDPTDYTTPTTQTYSDKDDTTDAFRVGPTSGAGYTNTTGQGVGRVFITPNDLRGTGWGINDSDGRYFAFVHYLYQYELTNDRPRVIGDGLNSYARWEIPADAP
jgi:hypothetical protein